MEIIIKILISVKVLWIAFFLGTIWEGEWSLKKKKNGWKHHDICFAERLDESAESKLVNTKKVPIVELEKKFHVDYTYDNEDDEIQQRRPINKRKLLKRDATFLTKSLTYNILVKNIETLAISVVNYSTTVAYEVDMRLRSLEIEIMKLINIIKEEVLILLCHSNSEIKQNLEVIYSQRQQTPLTEVDHAIDFTFQHTQTVNRRAIHLKKKQLLNIYRMKKTLQLKLSKVSRLLEMQRDINLNPTDKFPLCFILRDVKINNNIRSCRVSLALSGSAIVNIMTPQDRESRNTVTLHIRDVLMRINFIKELLDNISARMNLMLHKLTKHLYTLTKGPITRNLMLFLYIFQISMSKCERDRLILFSLKKNEFCFSKPLRTHLKKINKLEVKLLKNAFGHFKNVMRSEFHIDVKDPKLKFLSNRLSNSEKLYDILKVLSELVTLSIYRKVAIAQKETICQVKSVILKQLYHMGFSGNVSVPDSVNVPKDILISLKKSYKNKERIFGHVINVADKRQAAVNYRRETLRTINKCKGFLDMLNLLNVAQHETGKMCTANKLKLLYNTYELKNAAVAAGLEVQEEEDSITGLKTEEKTEEETEENISGTDSNNVSLNGQRITNKELYLLLFLIAKMDTSI